MSENVSRNSKFHKLAGEGVLFFASQVIALLIGVGRIVVTARILGPTYRGVYSLFCVIPELIIGFGTIGFGPAVLYFGGKKTYNLREIVGGTWIFSLVMGTVLAAVGVAVLHLNFIYEGENRLVRDYAVLLVLAIPLDLTAQLGYKVLVSQSKVFGRALLVVIQSVLPLVFFLGLLLVMKSSLTAAVTSWTLGMGVMAALPFVFLIGKGAYPPRWRGEFLKKSLVYGFASYFSQCFQMAMLRIDFVFVAVMLGPTELGYYAIASRLGELMLVLPQSLTVPFIPILFGMDKKDSDRFTPVVTKVVLAVMILACLAMALVGKIVIRVLFGADFLSAYPPLVVLLPGIVSFGIFPFLRFDLFGRNLPGKVSVLTGIGLAVNVALNWLLIPRWGLNGAAFSSSVAYTLSMVLLLCLYCRVSGNRFRQVLLLNRQELRSIQVNVMSLLAKRWSRERTNTTSRGAEE